MLREDDWNGALHDSITSGLSRWASEFGAQAGEFLPLNLYVSDNVFDDDEVDSYQRMSDSLRGQEKTQIGYFSLRRDRDRYMGEVAVLPVIERLNAIYPNAGWHLFRIVRKALRATCGVFDAQCAHDCVEFRISHYRDAPEYYSDCEDLSEEARKNYDAIVARGKVEELDEFFAETTGMLVPHEIKRQLPKGFFAKGAPRRAVLVEAQKVATQPDDLFLLEHALRLLDAVRRLEAANVACGWKSATSISFGSVLPPVIVSAWETDIVYRALDDEEEMLQQSEQGCVCWHAPFRCDDAASVERAARLTRCVIETIGAVEPLLPKMNEPRPRPDAPLIEVLAPVAERIQVRC